MRIHLFNTQNVSTGLDSQNYYSIRCFPSASRREHTDISTIQQMSYSTTVLGISPGLQHSIFPNSFAFPEFRNQKNRFPGKRSSSIQKISRLNVLLKAYPSHPLPHQYSIHRLLLPLRRRHDHLPTFFFFLLLQHQNP